MNLQQLRYFLAATEHGSFRGAAASLHLAQPSLSEQVRRLEGELGVPLFARVGRGVVPTEAGAALEPHARRVLDEVEQARAAVAGVRELRSGTASFGTFSTARWFLLADLVEDFHRRYPGVRMRLVGLNSSEVADAVREGTLEAGLVVLPIDATGLDVHPAHREDVLYISADPRRLRAPMTVERLAEAPLILPDSSYGGKDPTRVQLAGLAQRAGVRVEPQIEVEDLSAALDLCARGLGDTIAARGVTFDRRFRRALGAVPFAEPFVETFAFISRHGAALSPATRALVALAGARLDELDRRIAETAAAAS